MNSKVHKIPIALIGCVLGAITYLTIYGFKLLDVTHTIWLYDKYDLTQHYAGWLFYRNSNWHFPIGMMDTVTYPHLYSIVYTDAIPIFAILFKLLSPLLPTSFQYFGIWGIFCYSLQGLISALILERFFDNKIMIIIGVLFFTFSPWMLHRLYMHSSLAAHWILLLCILNSLKVDELSLKQYVLHWSFLFILSAGIHVYFIPMCAIFLGCNMLYKVWKNRKNIISIFTIIALSFIPIIAAAIVLGLLGAFSSSAKYNSGGFGEASANLNFLFNSLGKSKFFPALPHPYTKWPEESFGYLGIGIFILLFIAIIRIILDNAFRQDILTHKSKAIFTGILIIICIWLATNPEVAWNEYPLFRWVVPMPIETLLGIFRSLGRFVWPICYILLLFGLVSTGYKTINTKILRVGILLACLVLQLLEFSNFISGRSNETKQLNGYQYLDADMLDLFIEDYDHIYNFDLDNWKDIAMYAGTRQLTLNQTYLSRIDWQFILNEMEMEEIKLLNGESSPDTLYLFPLSLELDTRQINVPNLNLYKNSGFYIGSRNPIDSLQDFLISTAK